MLVEILTEERQRGVKCAHAACGERPEVRINTKPHVYLCYRHACQVSQGARPGDPAHRRCDVPTTEKAPMKKRDWAYELQQAFDMRDVKRKLRQFAKEVACVTMAEMDKGPAETPMTTADRVAKELVP